MSRAPDAAVAGSVAGSVVGRRGRDERGLMALELAILTPVVIALLLGVVALGRVTYGRQLVGQAAGAGARAASLATGPGVAAAAGQAAALQTLADAGVSCTGPVADIDASAFRPGGQVTATVRCSVDLAAMTLVGVPGRLTVQASATSPVEQYRDLATAGAP